MIIADTNVVSETMRPQPEPTVLQWLADVGSEVRLTAVTVAELRYGIAIRPQGDRRSGIAAAVDAVLRSFTTQILPFDSAAAETYGELAGRRRRRGRGLPILDLQIAAIARRHHAPLATRNTKDFAELGLVLVNPWDEAGPG